MMVFHFSLSKITTAAAVAAANQPRRVQQKQVIIIRKIVTLLVGQGLQQQQRKRHWSRNSACRRCQSKAKSSFNAVRYHPYNYRNFTSRWISVRDLLETSPDSNLSSLNEGEEEEGEIEKMLETAAVKTLPTDDDDDLNGGDIIATPTLPPDEVTTSLSQQSNVDDDDDDEIVVDNIQIPGGRDSQVIMVSDNLIDMVQRNSELIKASTSLSTLDESETTNEPWIGAVPLITYKGKETYFQFDYRHHPPIVNQDIKNLLRKIERVLRNIHLEPLGNFNRGVETMQKNVENMKEGEDYRVSRKTYSTGGLFQLIDEEKPRTTRFSLLKTLTERHALYATGNNPKFGQLKKNVLGQSLFGTDSEVEVKASVTAIILRDLWCNGSSTMFEGLQRRHFAMKRRKEGKILKSILEEEMKHISYPEPLFKYMVKTGKIDPNTGTGGDDNSMGSSEQKPRPNYSRRYR